MNLPIRILLGPTGSGKERLAVELAKRNTCDIISADSMKIYRGMDVGTASPLPEYKNAVRHWCIDIVEPEQPFSVADYLRAAEDAMREIEECGNDFIVSGGTALYYKALTEGLFPGPGRDVELRKNLEDFAVEHGSEALHKQLVAKDRAAALKIHPNDKRRLIRALEVIAKTGEPLSSQQTQFGSFRGDRKIAMAGLLWEREQLYERINRRVELMLASGLEKEARYLFQKGKSLSPQTATAVGYAEFFSCFAGELEAELVAELIKRNTRRLAKSQMTWFRKFKCKWIKVRQDSVQTELCAQIEAAWSEQLCDS